MGLDFSTRWTWWFESPNHLGAWTVAMLLFIAGFLHWRPAIKKWYYYACVAISICGIVILTLACAWAASRAAWLTLSCGLAVFIATARNGKSLNICVCISLLLVTAIFFVDRSRDRALTFSQYGGDASSQSRLVSWSSALRMAGENPLHGVGLGQYSNYYNWWYEPEEFNKRMLTANNDIFHLHAEGGILLGILILLGQMIIFAYLILSVRSKSWHCIVLSTATLSFFINGIFNCIIPFPALWPWVLAFFIGTVGVGFKSLGSNISARLFLLCIPPSVAISAGCICYGAYLQKDESCVLRQTADGPCLFSKTKSEKGHIIVGMGVDDDPRLIYRKFLTPLAYSGWTSEICQGSIDFFARVHQLNKKMASRTFLLVTHDIQIFSEENIKNKHQTVLGTIVLDPNPSILTNNIKLASPILVVTGMKQGDEFKNTATALSKHAQNMFPQSSLLVTPWATTWTRHLPLTSLDILQWMEQVSENSFHIKQE